MTPVRFEMPSDPLTDGACIFRVTWGLSAFSLVLSSAFSAEDQNADCSREHARVPAANALDCRQPPVFADLVQSRAIPADAAASPGSPPLRNADPDSTFTEIAETSLFGALRPDRWRRLSLPNLFSEGWDEPYAPVPHAAPRQTWIGNADGAFYRLFVLSGAYASLTQGDAATFSSILFTPFNRRFEIGWYAPWRVSTPSGTGPGQTASLSDLTVTPRLLLHESERVTVTTNLAVRLPTGNVATGNDVTSVSPDVEFWANPYGGSVIRGAVGVTLPTGRTAWRTHILDANPWSGFNANPGAFSSFDARLAVGQYVTPTTRRFLGDSVIYLSGNLHQGMGSPAPTYMTLTPGFRTGIWGTWYFLGGVELPVVQPKPFSYQVTFQLIGNF